MSELLYVTAQPFKAKGRVAIRKTEFIFHLVLDLKWFKPEEAKALLQTALKAGLIKQEGESVVASFDPSKVTPPLDFRPSSDVLSVEEESLFERILERIMLATGKDKRRIIAAINQNQEKLHRLVDIHVSALIVAMEEGVEVSDLLDAAYQELIRAQ